MTSETTSSSEDQLPVSRTWTTFSRDAESKTEQPAEKSDEASEAVATGAPQQQSEAGPAVPVPLRRKSQPADTDENAVEVDENQLSFDVLHSMDKEELKERDDLIEGLGLKIDFSKIPDKLEFKIGEVADILGVKTYVLRFWETEFEALKPQKSKSGQRVYRKRDVETSLLIKTLLYDERYSIEGARAALKKARHQVKATEQLKEKADRLDHALDKLQKLRTELLRYRNEWNAKSIGFKK